MYSYARLVPLINFNKNNQGNQEKWCKKHAKPLAEQNATNELNLPTIPSNQPHDKRISQNNNYTKTYTIAFKTSRGRNC